MFPSKLVTIQIDKGDKITVDSTEFIKAVQNATNI